MVKRGEQQVPTASIEQQQREGSPSDTHAADHGEVSSTSQEEIDRRKKPKTKDEA